MSLLANSNAIESGGYNIDRSLRFRSSASAYLNRTPASTSNRKTWTWSGWVKRGALSQTGTIWGSNFSSGGFGLAFGNYGGVGVNPEYIGVTLYAVGTVTTNAVFRDPSAWYHIVAKFDSTQATQADRFALYVNGVKQTLSGTLNVTLNADYNVNLSGALHVLGGESGYYNDLYLAEVNFIDGQALTPSSFGQTDAVTGVWTPKKYTGTYGTNGFYLDFKTNTSPTTLAQDKSGNNNNWTPNNISTTAGATYDSMTDVPTLTSATAANYCVLNPLSAGRTISQANMYYAGSATGIVKGTIGVSTGKWYWEFTAADTGTGVGVADITLSPTTAWLGNTVNGWIYITAGTTYNNATGTTGRPTFTTGDVIGVAVDVDNGKLWFSKNGSWIASGDPANGLNAVYSNLSGYILTPSAGSNTTTDSGYLNCGQRPFQYTPPTGFKALNTFNLPDPTIKKPSQYMDATTYTGTGASNAVVNAAGFQPDLVWLKNRNYGAGTNHVLVDSVRGTSVGLASNLTNADFSTTGNFSSINSNGFTVAGTTHDYNFSTDTFVGWQWKKGATPGFDIVTYTGTGTAQNISHNLGVAPKMIIVKARSGTSDWSVYTVTTGAGNYVLLNTMAASAASSTKWNNTTPTSSVFSVGIDTTTNMTAVTYVAYLFAEIPGFSKFGSYTGNGSSDGPFIHLGFRARWVLFKCITTGSHWVVCDTARDPLNAVGLELAPNNSNAENGTVGGTGDYDILSNGIKMRSVVGNEYNVSAYQYIFAAFAENPFKYSLAR